MFECTTDHTTMSSKKLAMDAKSKSSQSRKNRRRSTRNISMNGDGEDTKEKAGKRTRDCKEYEATYENTQDMNIDKDIINLVPSVEYDCCPSETPTPPGTRVNLHGVILHETEGGLIVLNVRWRNKVFSGALIDVEKNKWASDRILKEQTDSFQAPPPIRKIKIPTGTVSTAGEDSDSGNNKRKAVTSPTTTPSKNLKARNAGKKRHCHEATSPVQCEETPTKKNKLKVQNGGENSFECPELNCGRKYKNKNGLSYHRRTVHENVRKNDNTDDSGKENKSDDSDSGEDNFVIDEKAEETRDDEEDEEEEEDEASMKNRGDIPETEDSDKKEEMTENEKQIERLKLKTEKALLCIKQENEATGEESKEEVGAKENVQVKAVEPMVDVDGTADHPSRVEKTTTEGLKVPTIQVEATVCDSKPIVDEVKKEDQHPKGTCYTIIHEESMNSLNELFPPEQNYQQYSPTLSNLTPQRLNDSLTDALSKQQAAMKRTTVVNEPSSQPTLGRDAALASHKNQNVECKEVIKPLLTPKPSVEIKRDDNHIVEDLTKISLDMFSKAFSKDIVDCSEDERSVSPENLLVACHKAYPQDDRDTKVSKPNFLSATASNILLNPAFQTAQSQPQKLFENSLLFIELASKVSSAAVNINSLQTKIPALQIQEIVKSSNIDTKTLPPNMVNFIKPAGLVNADPKTYTVSTSEERVETKPSMDVSGVFDIQMKPSLLEQRLLAQTGKSDTTLTTITSSGIKAFLQPNISAGVPLSRKASSKLDVSSIDSGEKLTTASFTISRDRNEEKLLLAPPSSLRINPPITSDERIHIRSWYPDAIMETQQPFLSKEYISASQASGTSSFRLPLAKTSPASNLHVYTPTNVLANEKKSKIVLKRSTQPIPIAPAPSSTLQVPTSVIPLTTSTGYTSPESDKEQPQMGRYTLTSDNRLIPSPAENRGRPRKVRVEKTHQVPIGTAQEIARSRGPAESVLIRKHSASPVARPSVIQGSTHMPLDGAVISKMVERNPADGHPVFQHSVCHESIAGDRERFTALRQEKVSAEARNGSEKYKEYKGISSPPAGYFSSPQNRSILSPPRSTTSLSPRSVDALQRSSPGVNHEILSKAHYHQLALDRRGKLNAMNTPVSELGRSFIEVHRSKSDLIRGVPEGLRMVDPARQTALSPRDVLAVQSFMRSQETEADHRLMDFHVGRYAHAGVRSELPPGRNEHQRAMFERRTPTEEGDRMLNTRDRYLQQQPTLSIHRSPRTPPAPHSSAPPSHHSTNLVLGRADGAIIGPLSMYEYGTEHKR